MPRRKKPVYETPNSIYVHQRPYTIASADDHILESAGLGARQSTALQDLIDKTDEVTNSEPESPNPSTREQRYKCNPCNNHDRWCLAARAVKDAKTGISAPPRNARGVLCSACSRSRIMVGHENDWDDCDFGEVASRRAEDLSGRTRPSIGGAKPDTERSTDVEMGDGSENEVYTFNRSNGSEVGDTS